MSEPKLISPLLDNFIMGDPISNRHGIRCCPAMKKDTDDKYIVKIISIPASQTKLDALLLTGAYPSVEACQAYFKELAGDVVEEIDVLQKLSAQEGFVACEGFQVIPMDDGTGFEIYLLSKYRRSLERQIQKSAITHLEALNLGLDMCSALTACRRTGYLYADLKPSNIYITDNDEYRIGDLGFFNIDSLKYASLPEKYLSPYTAPEITDAFSALNTSMDIYSLGVVLYQIYNGGILPQTGEGAPSTPQYADDEISKIILKAIASDPTDRWGDPAQMGQAIVSYMQRYGARSEPIVPPVIPEPEPPATDEPEETIDDILASVDLEDTPEAEQPSGTESVPTDCEPEQQTLEDIRAVIDNSTAPSEKAKLVSTDDIVDESKDSAVYSEDDDGNLSFMMSTPSDVTEVDNTSTEDASDDLTDETSQILAQADALAELNVPDPVVVPEPIDVPIPPPIELPEDETLDPTEAEQSTEEPALDAPVVDDAVLEEALKELADLEDVEPTQTPAENTEDDVIEYDEDLPAKPEKKRTKYAVLALILTLLLVGGFLFYRFYYLQPIDSLEISGSKDQLTVTVNTKVDNELLTVVCENALYGKSVQVPVVDGKAYFSGLLADTEYVITVKVNGFHQLTGETTVTYFSPDESAIVNFEALTGGVNGSAELIFTLDGPDSSNWNVTYSTPGEEEKSISFSGHSVTLTDLTVGAQYTAKLTPEADLYVTGMYETTFIASNVIKAENLLITNLTNGQLSASWNAPANEIVEGWKVRCYNGTDYDKTITTNNTSITFTDVDHTDAFIVEVTAAGQTAIQTTQIGENSITVSNLTVDNSKTGTIALTWEATSIPEDGWVVSYMVEGMDDPITAATLTNSLSINTVLPGLDYTFTVQAADETPVVCVPAVCTTEAASNFRREYHGHTVTRNNLSFGMCRTPSKANWDYKDVKSSEYTRVFKPNQKASFVIFLNRVYGTSSEVINTTFAFYNEEDKLIDIASSSRTWTEMWFKNYCEMDIPTMPVEPGSYTVRIYFNGEYVTTQSFSIAE